MFEFITRLLPKPETVYHVAGLAVHLSFTIFQAATTYALFQAGSRLRVPALLLCATAAAPTALYVGLRVGQWGVQNCLYIPREWNHMVGGATLLLGPLHPISTFLLFGVKILGEKGCWEDYDAEVHGEDEYEDDPGGHMVDLAEWGEHTKTILSQHDKGSAAQRIVRQLIYDAIGKRYSSKKLTARNSNSSSSSDNESGGIVSDDEDDDLVSSDWLRRLDDFHTAKAYVLTPQIFTALLSALPWTLLVCTAIATKSCPARELTRSLFSTIAFLAFKSIPTLARCFTWRSLWAKVLFCCCDFFIFCFVTLSVAQHLSWSSSVPSPVGLQIRIPFGLGFTVSGGASSFFVAAKLATVSVCLLIPVFRVVASIFDRRLALEVGHIAGAFFIAPALSFLFTYPSSPLMMLVMLADNMSAPPKQSASARLLNQFLFGQHQSLSTNSQQQQQKPCLFSCVDWCSALALAKKVQPAGSLPRRMAQQIIFMSPSGHGVDDSSSSSSAPNQLQKQYATGDGVVQRALSFLLLCEMHSGPMSIQSRRHWTQGVVQSPLPRIFSVAELLVMPDAERQRCPPSMCQALEISSLTATSSGVVSLALRALAQSSVCYIFAGDGKPFWTRFADKIDFICVMAVGALVAVSSTVSSVSFCWLLLSDVVFRTGGSAPPAIVGTAAGAIVSLLLSLLTFRDFSRSCLTLSLMNAVSYGKEGVRIVGAGTPVTASCVASYFTVQPYSRLVEACGAPQTVPETCLTRHVLTFLSPEHIAPF